MIDGWASIETHHSPQKAQKSQKEFVGDLNSILRLLCFWWLDFQVSSATIIW